METDTKLGPHWATASNPAFPGVARLEFYDERGELFFASNFTRSEWKLIANAMDESLRKFE